MQAICVVIYRCLALNVYFIRLISSKNESLIIEIAARVGKDRRIVDRVMKQLEDGKDGMAKKEWQTKEDE